jgi:hypothetical protein
MQPRAEWLAAHRYLFTGPERIAEFCVLGLDEERELVLVTRVQQFQVESPVGAMP